jgi:hypothetical protein
MAAGRREQTVFAAVKPPADHCRPGGRIHADSQYRVPR